MEQAFAYKNPEVLQYLLFSKKREQIEFSILGSKYKYKGIPMSSLPISPMYPQVFFSPGGKYCAIPFKNKIKNETETGFLIWDVVSHIQKDFIPYKIDENNIQTLQLCWNSDEKIVSFYQENIYSWQGIKSLLHEEKSASKIILRDIEKQHNIASIPGEFDAAHAFSQNRLVVKRLRDNYSLYYRIKTVWHHGLDLLFRAHTRYIIFADSAFVHKILPCYNIFCSRKTVSRQNFI